MGTISSPRAIYGLSATGEPTKTNSTGDIQLGNPSTTIALTGATKAYTVSATLASDGDTITINPYTGVATIGTTPVAQVETATVVAAAGATSNGNLAVTVTAARVTGSPVAVSVELTTADNTAALVAAKIRAALTANAAIAAVYTVGGTGADVVLTETDPENDDATLNVAWAAGLGVSALTTSTNTTAGAGGVKLTNNTGDGKDFEGITMGTATKIHGLLLKNTHSTGLLLINGGTAEFFGNLYPGALILFTQSGGSDDTIADAIELEASGGASSLEMTILSE